MKGERAGAGSVPGPQRWHYRSYFVHERLLPTGRRFEVRTPKDEVVLFCRAKRSESRLVFFADESEATELFRLEPKSFRHYQRSFEAVDAVSGEAFARVHKKQYEPVEKTEWFIHSLEGEQLGMVTETAPSASLLRRLLPVARPKAWALHWGQAVAGQIQPRAGLMGERIEVTLPFDTHDKIDRRLVLGVTVAMRAELSLGNAHGAQKSG